MGSVAGTSDLLTFDHCVLTFFRPEHKTAVMGDAVDRNMRGTFYLKTRDRPRFALPVTNSTNCEINHK